MVTVEHTIDLKTISDWDFESILRYALFVTLQTASQSVTALETNVKILEALLASEIEMEVKSAESDPEKGTIDYYRLVNEKEKELREKYTSLQDKDKFIQELSTFKLSLLIKIMKKKLPTEIELEL